MISLWKPSAIHDSEFASAASTMQAPRWPPIWQYESMDLHLKVLGQLDIVRGGESISVNRPAQRRLLSILALEAGRRLSTDRLIDWFWPDDPPDTARAAIQTHVAALRRTLGDGVIVTEGYGYRLNLDDDGLDVQLFSGLAEAATKRSSSREWKTALEAGESALALWRGDPFIELADDDFALPEIRRLSELHLELLETRAEALVSLERSEEALSDLEALTVQHPYRERLWEHLMTARYRMGRNAEALQAFQDVSAHLAEIGVEPGEPLRRLEERILLHDQSLTHTRTNLPTELDRFIGREAELEELSAHVQRSRITGAVGAGGSGKTRMALQVARRMVSDFPDGVWLVSLADVDDPDLIHPTIAGALGLTVGPSDVVEVVLRFFKEATSLLVLDNCEHLLGPCAEVAAGLLGFASDLTILYTSREPMNVSGETRYVVPGLSVPDTTATGTEAGRHDSIRLFQERARQADPTFDSMGDYETQTSICRRLDGMPLAIELAARRVSSLSLEDIDTGLGQNSELLAKGDPAAHPRHQTLDATIDWSYRLASPDQRHALVTVSIFRGGFDLDMARWVLDEEAPELISDLVDQSLVVTYQGVAGRRYRLLETVRQFALDRATELRILEEVSEAHTKWAIDFTERIWDAWQNPGMDQVEATIHEEFDNLNSAFDREEDLGNQVVAGRIAEGLVWHWHSLGYLDIALSLYDRSLATCESPDRRVALIARRASVLFTMNRADEALTETEMAYRLQAELAPSEAKAYAVSSYAHMFAMQPQLDARDGLPYAEEAVAVAEETDNDLLIAALRLDVALALGWAGEGVKARSALEEAVDGVETLGDPSTVAYTYMQAATVGMQIGDLRRSALADYSGRLVEWLDLHPHIASRFRMGWVEWAMIQRGELVEIENQLRKWSTEDHLEGFNKLGNLVPLGVALWMQGQLEDARDIVTECELVGVNPRWFHDFMPLKVDVLVDLGRLDEATTAAEEYLQFETDAGESAMKLGVLNPLARGVADLAGTPSDSDDLAARAESVVKRMEDILAQHPPRMDGSVSMETPATHLLFAKAEATRLFDPDPASWRAAMDAADFLYFRLYARIRLGEALLACGEIPEGREHLAKSLDEAHRMGADRLTSVAEDILNH